MTLDCRNTASGREIARVAGLFRQGRRIGDGKADSADVALAIGGLVDGACAILSSVHQNLAPFPPQVKSQALGSLFTVTIAELAVQCMAFSTELGGITDDAFWGLVQGHVPLDRDDQWIRPMPGLFTMAGNMAGSIKLVNTRLQADLANDEPIALAADRMAMIVTLIIQHTEAGHFEFPAHNPEPEVAVVQKPSLIIPGGSRRH